MSLTTDPNDPRLVRKTGPDESPAPQNDVYLILPEEERKRGFVRPYRNSYRHVGEKPKYPIRPLTDDETARYGHFGYVAYEEYPKDGSTALGRYWTQRDLDARACGAETKMGVELSETYARNPKFYGATYCVGCQMHRPVQEFVWTADGTVVGS